MNAFASSAAFASIPRSALPDSKQIAHQTSTLGVPTKYTDQVSQDTTVTDEDFIGRPVRREYADGTFEQPCVCDRQMDSGLALEVTRQLGRLVPSRQSDSGIGGDTEHAVKTTAAGERDLDRAARRHPLDPAQIEKAGEQCSAQRAGDVRLALAPIEAWGGECAAARAHFWQVNAHLAEELLPHRRHVELRAVQTDRAAVEESAGETNAQAAREMIVAGAPGTDGATDARLAMRARRPCGASTASASSACTTSGLASR